MIHYTISFINTLHSIFSQAALIIHTSLTHLLRALKGRNSAFYHNRLLTQCKEQKSSSNELIIRIVQSDKITSRLNKNLLYLCSGDSIIELYTRLISTCDARHQLNLVHACVLPSRAVCSGVNEVPSEPFLLDYLSIPLRTTIFPSCVSLTLASDLYKCWILARDIKRIMSEQEPCH